jgi:hypothetical protein
MSPWRERLLPVLVAALVIAVGALAVSSSTAERILVAATIVLLGTSALLELRERRRSRRRPD